MSYARARLWLGITGVGLLVVASTVALLLGLPAQLLGASSGSLGANLGALAGLLGMVALALLPLDVLGGLVLPRRFGREAPGAGAFALNWIRGVLSLVLLTSTSGAVLIEAGRVAGRPGAIAALVLGMLAWSLMQEPLARLIGGLRRVDVRRPAIMDDVLVLDGDDEGFSGGFAGLGGRQVVPARWLRELDGPTLTLVLERRRRLARSGARVASLALAVLWNVLGFTLASWLPGAGVASVAELAATALGFTLWTFVGLLVLPTPSRRATLAADADAASSAREAIQLAGAVRTLDRLQDDEPERSLGVESVFHPVPSATRRARALEGRGGRTGWAGTWHLARTALGLSHLGLALLPRAVHCNVGRPELWVYLPTDG